MIRNIIRWRDSHSDLYKRLQLLFRAPDAYLIVEVNARWESRNYIH